jgi:hypothetical protein
VASRAFSNSEKKRQNKEISDREKEELEKKKKGNTFRNSEQTAQKKTWMHVWSCLLKAKDSY